MYMQVQIHGGEEDAPVDAFEHFDEDLVLGYVSAEGAEIDMSMFDAPRVVYVSREVLDELPV